MANEQFHTAWDYVHPRKNEVTQHPLGKHQ